jgi:perosamine synthetase
MNSTSKYLPSAGPSITDLEIKLVTEAVSLGWYDNRNMHSDQFINEFKQIVNRIYVLPCSNCTAAIHLSLLALGITGGDEVIVPDVTWIASVAPITYVGAMPIFVDINEDDWCISASSVKKAITPKTKAIVIVNLYGNMPQMDYLLQIAKDHNLYIIEDAAESLGAKYNSIPSGAFGDISVFSFNATKLAMAGQGGILATNDEKLYEKAKLYSHHGMIKYTDKTTFWSVVIGYNYQWTNIQAALALAQIRRLDELVEGRRNIFNWYKKHLEKIPGITLNSEKENVYSTYWVVTIIVDASYGLKKEEMLAYFTKHKIDCRPFFYPASSMPAYKNHVPENMENSNPVSYNLSRYGISLPSAASLSEEDVEYVCDIFKIMLKEGNKS